MSESLSRVDLKTSFDRYSAFSEEDPKTILIYVQGLCIINTVINRHSGIVICSGIALCVSSAEGQDATRDVCELWRVYESRGLQAERTGHAGQVTDGNSLQYRFKQSRWPKTRNRFACEKAICKMPVIHTG